jgi:hypothetical protein
LFEPADGFIVAEAEIIAQRHYFSNRDLQHHYMKLNQIGGCLHEVADPLPLH